MNCHRTDGQEVLLFEISWEQDQKFRTNPAVLTSLLREQVPVLDFVDWQVRRVEPGLTESRLPLNPQSTNQHFTHQAATLLLAADYTGGIALGSLIFGWPVVGVHPVSSSKSISLWLIKGDIKYLRPSVGDLTVYAEVDPEKHGRIRRRFLDGKPVLETLKISFRNGDIDVAEAELTYFARQSEKLRSDGVDPDKVNILYQLKLTSSAELIAGVRARETGKLFHDPYAARMAGQHGVSLATRFCEKSPQLAGMVAARTRHLDIEMMQFLARGGRDVVIAGVGWDMRPFRLDMPPGTRVYELDFSTTLIERRNRLSELAVKEQPGVTRFEIPLDLRSMPLAAVLKDLADRQVPVFIAWEGMSMYFQDDEVRAILQGMAPLLGHPESRLWVDLVDRRAVESPEIFPSEVQAFMRGMQVLGEPFTFGIDSIQDFMADNGFRCHDVVGSDVFFEDKQDPVYSLYKFCVASGDTTMPVSETDQRWLVHPGEEAQVPAKPHQQPAEEFVRDEER